MKLDDTSGSTTRDTVAGRNGALSGDTAVVRGRPPVAPIGAASFNFPGWQQGATIDADASSVVIPNFAGFNPGAKAFRVELWVRPDDSTMAAVLGPTDSPNIIQKGLAGATRQQWKIALKKDLTPVCVFKGDNGTALEEREANSGFRLGAGQPYRLRCELNAGKVTLRVYDVSGHLLSTSLSAQSGTPFSVTNTDAVWLGKKPDATNAGDAYAGLIDNVIISKGA